jgi:hypothetical protein
MQCLFNNCRQEPRTRGFCHKHYKKLRRTGELELLPREKYTGCSVQGCEKKHHAKGYCDKHSVQMRKYGEIQERTCMTPNEFVIDGDTCRIKLYRTDGSVRPEEAIVDKGDFEKVKEYKWAYGNKKGLPVHSMLGGKSTCLQHLILGKPPEGMLIYFKDGNKLNCKKSNLTFSTASQRGGGKKISVNSTSGYKGVVWHKTGKKWMAAITVNRKYIYLGLFKDKNKAAEAYNEAALEHFGEFAFLNKIEGE